MPGWPIFDTAVVTPEYVLEGRRVDFALLHPEEHPRVFLEVKKIGQAEGADRQLFEYAFYKGVPIAVLSDGQEWHFYLPSGQGDYSERRVYKLDLLEREPAESCERLRRYLSYEAVCSGKAVQAARADYQDVSRERQVRDALPKAWRRLLEGPDELLLELLAEKVEDICGFKPDSDTCAEYLRTADPFSPMRQPYPPKPFSAPATRGQSQDGPKQPDDIGFVLNGDERPCRSAREVMISLFELLAERDPSFLERFAARKHGSTRRYIARNQYELYPGRSDLCERESHRLRDGWYIGTNYSRDNIKQIIQLACEVAGIRFGRDLTINLGKQVH